MTNLNILSTVILIRAVPFEHFYDSSTLSSIEYSIYLVMPDVTNLM